MRQEAPLGMLFDRFQQLIGVETAGPALGNLGANPACGAVELAILLLVRLNQVFGIPPDLQDAIRMLLDCPQDLIELGITDRHSDTSSHGRKPATWSGHRGLLSAPLQGAGWFDNAKRPR